MPVSSSVGRKRIESQKSILDYLSNFQLSYKEENVFSESTGRKTLRDTVEIAGISISRFTNEFWTSGQRQGNSLHEISYRACFKPQLPKFFIQQLSLEKDFVYDPFSGRGTTAIEAALLNRNVIANDINPLSAILCRPRLEIPTLEDIKTRLSKIRYNSNLQADIDLSMFYSSETEAEIVSLKKYLSKQLNNEKEDYVDRWIRMVATNRLTGHSVNFFSVYTFPPNQAVSAEKQKKINEQRKQKPIYKNTKEIILKKSNDLLKNIDEEIIQLLKGVSVDSQFLTGDSRNTSIADNMVQLTVTSPPFLDVVQYAADNWLRCWFNEIDVAQIEKKITMSKKLDDWLNIMQDVFTDLYRVTRNNGWVAFEVGEIRNGKIKLDEEIIPIGIKAGLECTAIVINEQQFTKTANIWGIKNNKKGTNTNRIVLFQKKK
jgi:hypothetical protein